MIHMDHAALCISMPGHNHGPSIKNPKVYEALRRKRGMSKERAARISNAMVKKESAASPTAVPPTGYSAAFNQPGIESRRAKLRRRKMKIATKAPNYGARAGQTIAGALGRANDGKFTRAGSAQPAKQPKGKPSKAPGKPSAERDAEREAKRNATAAQRAAEQAAARDAAYRKLNIAPDGQKALEALRTGEPADADAIARAGLIDAGLVEQDSTGAYHLTPSGRATVNAASRGDSGRAGDTIASARDRLRARRERIAARDQKKRDREQAKLSATKAAGSPGDYLVVEDPQKPSTWHLQVKRNGTPDHGLMGGAWAALHGGYRGNKYQGPNKAEALVKLKRLYAAEKMQLPSEKSFTVFKDATGHDRWLSISSTAYRDRDGEIVSRKALQQAVAMGDSTGQRGPLRFWHVPGLDIGQCDYQATAQDGRFLIESGTFSSPAYAQAVKANGDGYQMSIGFLHPETQPDSSGVFHDIAIFERSIVPPGRASNPFTHIRTKEQRMLSTEKLSALKALLGDTPELTALISQVQATDKAAQERGTAYKDDSAAADPPGEVAIGGLVYVLKAMPPPAADPVEEEKAPPMADPSVDVAVDPTADPMEPEGDEGPLLTEADASMIASAVVAALGPLLDMEKKLRGYMDEMKASMGGMLGQKDASEAETKAALAEAQRQIAVLNTELKEIKGDQPEAGYRASQRAESAILSAALKAAGQLPGMTEADTLPITAAGALSPAEQAVYKNLWGDTP